MDTVKTIKAVFLVISSIVVLPLLFSCAASGEPTESGTLSGSGGAGDSPGSIVALPGYERLVGDMEAGLIPQSANVLYDQSGSRPDVDVTDEETIRQIYAGLCRIEVVGETDVSVTDCYHHVIFTLQDGTQVKFAFESEEILDCGGNRRYSVTDGGELWSLVRDLQDAQMGILSEEQ
ncbi:MAG: hypothetical protein MSA55_06805 [Coriobacteriaceae bacterium]|nr:hypothetical protein [Coriobacteriaceae bacterium]